MRAGRQKNRETFSTFLMSVRTIVVCEAQVPFVSGGAESLSRELVAQLRGRGYLAELISIPFQCGPKEEILSHAAAWRLIDLSESNGVPIDLAITTKFPTYFVRHPNKISWLLHQHRAAYELCGTPYSNFQHTEEDVGLRESIIELDTRMLSECRRLFTIAKNTASRLQRFNGLNSELLYHPPRLAGRLQPGIQGNYVLSVGRLESVKRVDLLIRAMSFVDKPIKLLIAGEGSQRDPLETIAAKYDVLNRVKFLGRVQDEHLIQLYADSLAVAYTPYDEDYGYVTLEAFLSHKPVITATDSGGTLEFVKDGVNGKICEPAEEAIANAINTLADKRQHAASLGAAGYEIARQITWDGVIEKLVGNS